MPFILRNVRLIIPCGWRGRYFLGMPGLLRFFREHKEGIIPGFETNWGNVFRRKRMEVPFYPTPFSCSLCINLNSFAFNFRGMIMVMDFGIGFLELTGTVRLVCGWRYRTELCDLSGIYDGVLDENFDGKYDTEIYWFPSQRWKPVGWVLFRVDEREDKEE